MTDEIKIPEEIKEEAENLQELKSSGNRSRSRGQRSYEDR